MRTLLLVLLVAALPACAQEKSPPRLAQYSGMCDASGAVAVTADLFLVASDEDNTLRLYRRDQPGPAVKEFDCNAFLELRGKSLEADLEGAARIGDRAFWVGSHGRNKDGKDRPNRCRLFATDLKVNGGDVSVTPVGHPCKTLLEDLNRDARFAPFHLAEAATRAPKDAGALNIEGLSATPEGHLLLGFRNPIPGGKALLIPLLNPNEVIEGKPARFDPAILLDLGGLGIRDIALHENTYIIIAGSYHGGGKFQFYRWSGKPGDPVEAMKARAPKDYTPEAIIIYPDKGLREIQILSDDGTRLLDGVACKDCPEHSRQTFRSFWIGE